MSKFNINEIVLFQNGERFELGIIKEVIIEAKHYWKVIYSV